MCVCGLISSQFTNLKVSCNAVIMTTATGDFPFFIIYCLFTSDFLNNQTKQNHNNQPTKKTTIKQQQNNSWEHRTEESS